MAAPAYALPAGHKLMEILSGPKKMPLIFASKIFSGETNMYADYDGLLIVNVAAPRDIPLIRKRAAIERAAAIARRQGTAASAGTARSASVLVGVLARAGKGASA